jgi:RAP domain
VGSRKNTRTQDEEETSSREPWRAGYYTSCKTQQRIKDAATASSGLSMTAPERSALVLRTYLDTPPERTNPANLVCALTSSAKVLFPGSQMNERGLQLFFRATDVLDQMMSNHLFLSGRQLCNAVWAIARHYERDASVLPPAGERTAVSIARARGVAETWNLADLERAQNSPARRLDALVDRIAAEIARQLERDPASVKVGELSMACWAYGVIRPRNRPPGWKHGPQLASIQRRQPPNDEVERSSSVLTLKFESWSSSSLDSDDEVEESDPPNEVDKLLDAVGRALLVPSNSTIQEDCLTRVADCQWKELANMAWAFASHGRSSSMDSQRVLLEIASETARRLRQHQQREEKHGTQVLSRDVSQIIWSLGILQTDNYRLADGLVEVVSALVDYPGVATASTNRPFLKWSCADIVQVVLSLAHARVDEPDLLRHMFREAAYRLEGDGRTAVHPTELDFSSRTSFHAWEVSILLWSQARLYLKEPQGEVFDRFARVATSYLCERTDESESLTEIGIRAQEQANIAWSLTVLEAYQDPNTVQLLARIFDEAAHTCKREGIIHLEHAHQLWQAIFLLEEGCPEAVQSVPAWFYNYLQDKWTAEKSRTKVSSARHKALSQTLTAMGIAHKNEHDEDIDVAIVLKPSASWVHETSSSVEDDARRTPARTAVGNSVRVAVEFDGPNHFTRQKPAASPFGKPEKPRALGHTVLKYRLLKKQGWIVVRVPYYEFDRIPFWASMVRDTVRSAPWNCRQW